eukprot:3896614-Pyramimonas_sp.AAC.1
MAIECPKSYGCTAGGTYILHMRAKSSTWTGSWRLPLRRWSTETSCGGTQGGGTEREERK